MQTAIQRQIEQEAQIEAIARQLRSRTYLRTERERLPATPTYGRTTTETTRYRERASESSTKEPQAKQKAIKREQRRRLSKAGVAPPGDIGKSVRE